MAAAAPPFPPTASPPAVPDGWKAEWGPEYHTWYYQNLSTQATQWEPPVPFPQAPPPQQSYIQPQPYSEGSTPFQQYPSPPPEGVNGLDGMDGPDGERGLGKVVVGGGLLALAGTMLHSALKKHDHEQEKPQKSKFDFFTGNAQAPIVGAVTGFFAGNNNTSPPPSYPSPPATTPPAGGFFSGITSHFPPGMTQGNSPPLHIHCAAYSDRDVTQIVRGLVTPGQSVEFDTDKLTDLFGDPWPGNRKQFSILYSYGQRPWELVASSDRDGTWSIIPHQPLDKARMEFVVQDPRARLVALVWGKCNGLLEGQGQVEKIKEIETTGEFEASNSHFGFDGMCGPTKTAVAYYRTPNGSIAISTARENGTLRMPWNPLAKWT